MTIKAIAKILIDNDYPRSMTQKTASGISRLCKRLPDAVALVATSNMGIDVPGILSNAANAAKECGRKIGTLKYHFEGEDQKICGDDFRKLSREEQIETWGRIAQQLIDAAAPLLALACEFEDEKDNV